MEVKMKKSIFFILMAIGICFIFAIITKELPKKTTDGKSTESSVPIIKQKPAPEAAKIVIPDIIEMRADYDHKKSIVEFAHKKHFQDLKINCSECHHDKNGKTIIDPTLSNDTLKCFNCHNKPGKSNTTNIDEEELLKFHAEALHENCIECHRIYNQTEGTQKAPQKCSNCHIKKEKKPSAQIEGC